MAEQIKTVAKFSEDAISVALNSLTEEEWKHFQKGLDIISKNLGTKEKKEKKDKQAKLSDEVIFKEYLIARIRQRMVEIEKQEAETKLEIIIDFAIKTDYRECSLDEMLKEHAKIIQTEAGLNAMTLIAQYSRGLLYLQLAENLKQTGKSLREFIDNGGLNVSYSTALRYITLASIVLKYPRLVLCPLTFSQIIKHKKRLMDFLSHPDGHDLKCRLALSVEIIAGGHRVNMASQEINTPEVEFNTDPDWEYKGIHRKAAMMDKQLEMVVESRQEPEDEMAALDEIL